MKVEMQLRGVDGVLRTLRSLPPELVSKRGGPVKLALAKGARLLRDQVKANLQAVLDPGEGESTGLLAASIIASRGKQPSGGKGERYLVRVKRKAYPNRRPERQGGVASVRKSASLKEYGSSKQQAKPFIRPAVAQKGAQVIETVTNDLLRRVDQTVQRLARENRNAL